MDWISVNEKLPKDKQMVRAYCPTIGKILVGRFYDYRKYNPGSYHFRLVSDEGKKYNVKSAVTAWMPFDDESKGE